MVEKRMHIIFNGISYEVAIRYRIKDWKSSIVMEQLGIKDPTWLMQYDKHCNCATVDKDAPNWYIKLATLHEMICVGHLYGDIVSEIMQEDIQEGAHHCESVERFILKIADEHRQEYIEARIKMFELILEKRLNPTMQDEVKNTLAMLISER